MISEVYLGLGSNLGDSVDNLKRGVALISDRLGDVEVSSIYETTPVGFTTQPGFFNAACRLWTNANPFELMHTIREIEATIGRHRTFVNAPRTLDVDILIYGRLVLNTPSVKVPHPRLKDRTFALAPLVELAPSLIHPALGLSLTELLHLLPDEPSRVVALPRQWSQSRSDGGSRFGMVSLIG